MPITAFYAALLAVLFLVLSFRVIGVRRGQRVEIGDGGDKELLRRMRVHANFAEYVPLALVLLALAEVLEDAGVVPARRRIGVARRPYHSCLWFIADAAHHAAACRRHGADFYGNHGRRRILPDGHRADDFLTGGVCEPQPRST